MARRNRSAPRAAPTRNQKRTATTSTRSSMQPSKPSVPAPVAPASVPAMTTPQQPSLFAQMASTAAGVAVGSTVGHTVGHAVTGMFSGGSAAREEAAPAPVQQQTFGVNACEADNRAFLRCLEQNNNDIGACQVYYDLFKQCMQSQGQTLN